MSDFRVMQRKNDDSWEPLIKPDSEQEIHMDDHALKEFIDMFLHRGGIKIEETYNTHPVFMTGVTGIEGKEKFKLFISYDLIH